MLSYTILKACLYFYAIYDGGLLRSPQVYDQSIAKSLYKLKSCIQY